MHALNEYGWKLNQNHFIMRQAQTKIVAQMWKMNERRVHRMATEWYLGIARLFHLSQDRNWREKENKPKHVKIN